MAKIPFEKSSGNVFADIGFTPAEAAELTAKSRLIIAIKDTIEQRKLTQQEAARLSSHLINSLNVRPVNNTKIMPGSWASRPARRLRS